VFIQIAVLSGFMTTYRKILEKVIGGRSDANIRFDDLRNLLARLGFEERSRGSHHVFVRAGVEEMINLQREGSMAKPYQVRQVRAVITKYGLHEEGEN
jgi:hypothetical protein